MRPSDWAASAGAGTKCVHKDEMASGEVGCVYRCRGPEPDENLRRAARDRDGAPPARPAPPPRVLHFPEKSGIYHFLINFSSGMGEWYMKVVFEVLILFSLLSLISFT